jgi:hypothetical protein
VSTGRGERTSVAMVTQEAHAAFGQGEGAVTINAGGARLGGAASRAMRRMARGATGGVGRGPSEENCGRRGRGAIPLPKKTGEGMQQLLDALGEDARRVLAYVTPVHPRTAPA